MSSEPILTTHNRGCIASALRINYAVALLYTSDLTWAFVPVGAAGIAEIASIMLVACFPVYPRLYQYLGQRLRGADTATTGGGDAVSSTSLKVLPSSTRRSSQGWTAIVNQSGDYKTAEQDFENLNPVGGESGRLGAENGTVVGER